MTCDPSNVSVSLTALLKRCTTKDSCDYAITATLQEVTHFSCNTYTIPADGTFTPTVSPSPVQLVILDAPSEFEIRVNGGAEWLRVDRMMIWTTSLTEIEFRNELLDPPEDLVVDVYFVEGVVL